MSAFSHTSWTVYCNGPDCKEQVTDAEWERLTGRKRS